MIDINASLDMPTPRPALATDMPDEILRFATDQMLAGRKVALAILVGIVGGSAKSVGAMMAVSEDGRYSGYVSGGCTESAVAAEALLAIANGQDRRLRLGAGSKLFDIVLPCGGGLDIVIHVAAHVVDLLRVVHALSNRRQVSLSYIAPGRLVLAESNGIKTGWTEAGFHLNLYPRSRLIVAGGSHELEATVRVAKAAAMDVLILGPGQRPERVIDQIDEASAIALLYHDLDKEQPLLQLALKSPAFYIGALGSAKTHEKRLSRLGDLGFSGLDCSRIKAPIGLFPKAKDAQSLALSVVADVAARRAEL